MSYLNNIILNGVEYSIGGSSPVIDIPTNTNDISAYNYFTMESGILANDGTITTGTSFVTDYLPVFPAETLVMSNALITKVAYYSENLTFVSLITTQSGINDYIVPSEAYFARYQIVYANGSTPPLPFEVRRKGKPVNNTFLELIKSPIKTSINVGITGDSNTVGYGLPTGSLSWANLLAESISSVTNYNYSIRSEWTESIGALKYGSGFNFKKDSEFSIWTDATTITLGNGENYSSTWKWFVDGVESGTASSDSLTLDGEVHKVTVQFTGGQLVSPYFVIEKSITFENVAVSGVGPVNVPIPTGKDWLIIMIGTNSRSINITANTIRMSANEYGKKGTFIVPFPNHKSDSSYTHSEWEQYSSLSEVFKNIGYGIIDCSPENAYSFYDNSLYQSDGIHISAKGHRIMANIISGKLGIPLYLKDES